jgi:hypothetical protein
MLLDARFREHDGRETTDFFCEFLRQWIVKVVSGRYVGECTDKRERVRQ